jgi:transposase
MPKPYSADRRERVLLAGEAGVPPAVAAGRFGVGLSRVYLWRQQARGEGRRRAKPHGGGRAPGIDPAGEAILRGLVSERNDRTLAEYAAQLAARTGRPRVSRPVLCRARRRLGLGRKKRRCAPANKIAPTSKRPTSKRPTSKRPTSKRPTSKRNGRFFASGSAGSTPGSWSLSTRPASPRPGITTAMTRLYARAPRGERAYGSAPAATGGG